jgi:hypothetical protein
VLILVVIIFFVVLVLVFLELCEPVDCRLAGPIESAPIFVGFRSDRDDYEGVAYLAVERAPRAFARFGRSSRRSSHPCTLLECGNGSVGPMASSFSTA